MKFINKGKGVQVRQPDGLGRFKWEDVKTGETIELPEDVGLRYGFEKVTESIQKVTEGKIGKTKVETKQFEEDTNDEFFKELTKINGIGPKTAKDIVIWGTREKLINAIKINAELPFRDDICLKLKKQFLKKDKSWGKNTNEKIY